VSTYSVKVRDHRRRPPGTASRTGFDFVAHAQEMFLRGDMAWADERGDLARGLRARQQLVELLLLRLGPGAGAPVVGAALASADADDDVLDSLIAHLEAEVRADADRRNAA
jgi:hypothetical protein